MPEEPDLVEITFSIDRGLYERLMAHGHANERDLDQTIRHLLREALPEPDPDEDGVTLAAARAYARQHGCSLRDAAQQLATHASVTEPPAIGADTKEVTDGR